MADTLWITEDYIKNNSVISENTDVKLLRPAIIWCQDTFIKELLGTKLFNEINNQIEANTVSALNQTLLNEYVKKTLINYAMSECSPDILFRYANKSLLIRTSENSQSISIENMQWEMARYKNKAEVYRQRAINYLIQERENYPLYEANTDSSDIQPITNSYRSPIYFPDDDNYKSNSPFRQ